MLQKLGKISILGKYFIFLIFLFYSLNISKKLEKLKRKCNKTGFSLYLCGFSCCTFVADMLQKL